MQTLKATLLNSALLIILGLVSIPLCDGDATAAAFVILIALATLAGALDEHYHYRARRRGRQNRHQTATPSTPAHNARPARRAAAVL